MRLVFGSPTWISAVAIRTNAVIIGSGAKKQPNQRKDNFMDEHSEDMTDIIKAEAEKIIPILDADDIAWGQTKLDYAQPNSTVDMGELFYWACRWHEKYHESMQIREMTLREVVYAISDVHSGNGEEAFAIAKALAKLGTIRIVESEK